MGHFSFLETKSRKKVCSTDIYITKTDVHICQSVTNTRTDMPCSTTPSTSGSMSGYCHERASLHGGVTTLQDGRWLVSLTRSVLQSGGRWGDTAKRSWSICAEQHPAEKEDGRNPKIHSLWQHISTVLGFLPLFSPPHGLPGTWIRLMEHSRF